MKKVNKLKSKAVAKVSPEEAVAYIEAFNKMIHDKDEATVAISLRIPGNLLQALKTTAKLRGVKYQSLLVNFIRQGLRDSEKS